MKKAALIFCALIGTSSMAANVISQTVETASGTVTLKVLPAETFMGKMAEMKWDGGAKADAMKNKPNHHMVVFLSKNGKPMEKANVKIRYRALSNAKIVWTDLPVARMHVKGKGAGTTHFGNNLTLTPGDYQAEVTVNHAAPISFNFTIQ